MDGPIRFPHPADVIAEEAERLRHLSIAERLAILADLVATARTLTRGTCAWEVNRQFQPRSEAEWQRAHREVFAAHVR